MSALDIWLAGDTHGSFAHLVRAVKVHRPAAVVLLGDVQATRPLQTELAEVIDSTALWWISGNHDADSETDHDHLFGSTLRDRNLHGRVENIAGVRIGGLGGVFRARVWRPPAAPVFHSAEALLRATAPSKRWRGGVPLQHTTTIFYDDYQRLSRQAADVLVTHEAPGVHPHGNEAIELLAAAMC